MKKVSISIMCLIFIAGLFPAYAQTNKSPVGYIIDLDGSASTFELLRNGKKKRFSIMTVLYEDDQLWLKKPQKCKKYDKCMMTLKIGEHNTVILDKKNPTYTVPEIERPPSIPVALMKWAAMKWFKTAYKEHRQARLLITKGGADIPLSMPLLVDKEIFMAEGKRKFHLAWRGGKQPFKVRIFFDGKTEPFLELQNIEDKRLQKENLEFAEGSYHVEITDAKEAKVIGEFQTVSKEKLSALMSEVNNAIKNSTLEDKVKETLSAIKLVDQNSAWSFEAYQRISQFAGSYFPAFIVQGRLEAHGNNVFY
ncbi:MAG: hypothetical protein GY795_01770 [Desulfobacterales bacterium]|nr:hypothetical protein [Desulfobacterales bacterium]